MRCLYLPLFSILLAAGGALAQTTLLPPFSAMAPGTPAAPWRVAGLPGQKPPLTQFAVQAREGRHVLRVATDASYGNLVLDTRGQRLGPDASLRWSWSLERGLPASDLRTRTGDDAPLKVCALFDMPLEGLSLGERTKLRMARSISGEALPAATLCYVWDRLLPVGTQLANAYSARVRFIVVATGEAHPGQWSSIERRLASDFLQAFGHESATVPPLQAIAVGGDADNSGGQSLGFLADVSLVP